MEPSVIARGDAPTPQAQNRNAKKLRKVEQWLCLALVVAFVLFRIQFYLHAGALWRDEVNSVNVSTSPTIADIWHNLPYDSFPMLWHLVLRYWIFSGIGSSDHGIRLLGLLASLGILSAIVFNARRFRTNPLIVLALLGFSGTVICDGGAIRGYGLGVMLELFTFTLIWEVATRPTAVRVVAAFLIALAAVQMLFYNSIILAAICCGALAVTASHRQWRRAAIVVGIGLLCAASTAIYLPVIHRAEIFLVMLRVEPSIGWLLTRFGRAVSYNASTSPQISMFNVAAWGVASLLALIVGLVALLAKREPAGDSFRKDAVVYHWTILCAGLLGYSLFLWRLRFPIQPWHSLALMAIVAICADGLIGSYRGIFARRLVCVTVVAFCCITAIPVWADSGLRKTAIDSDSEKLKHLAKKGDLIVVSPWFYGISFQRYYHGPADFVTVPPVGSLAYHNYYQLFPAMQDLHAMDATIDRITNVLKSGHDVYLFGEFQFPSSDPAYPTLDGPAPHNSFGWNDADYYDLWERQIAYVVAHHAIQAVPVYVDFAGISDYERPWMFAAHGWSSALDSSIPK
jgi:hypothetical protein